MGINLPLRRLAERPNYPSRRIPIEQILAVQGQNPLATGVESAGAVLGKALAKMKENARQKKQIAAIQEAFPGEIIPEGIKDPTLALSLLGKKAELTKANKEQQYGSAVYDETGNVTGFSLLPKGVKPFSPTRGGAIIPRGTDEKTGETIFSDSKKFK